jgi:PIN domain nuclease of toxin-antitoxin system
MRYLLDTHILFYFVADHSKLDRDVTAILEDADNLLCVSAETIRELIVAYKNKGFTTKRWKNCEELINSIENVYGVSILPLDKHIMQTYSELTLNEAQGHKDPSDHVIISHAITLGLPLISSDSRFDFYCKQGLQLIFNKK